MVFLAGFVDAIAGGGGLVSLPAYLLAGVPVHHALATNKLSSCIGTFFSTYRFWKKRYADIAFIFPAVVAALAGSSVGARLVLLIDGRLVERFLIVVLPLVAIYVFRRKNIDAGREPLPRRKAMLLATGIALIVGCYDGFYGPGTGTFLIILFSAVCRMDVRAAAGNTKMVNLASNLAGAVVFFASGVIDVKLGLAASVFSIAGHYIGAGLAIKQGYRIVRPIVLTVLALLFLKIVAG